MAQPSARSANAELHKGSVDGTYKSVTRDRGGVVEDSTYQARRSLDDVYYGLHELGSKELPDASGAVATPFYQATPEANSTKW